MSKVIELNEDNFYDVVLKNKKPVVVDFWAEWCQPCKNMSPIFEAVAEETEDAVFAQINAEKNEDIAGKYGIMSIPAFKIFKDGEVIDEFTGAMSKEDMLERIGLHSLGRRAWNKGINYGETEAYKKSNQKRTENYNKLCLKILKEYENTEKTQSQLAEKYEVSRRQICDRIKRARDIVRGGN